MGEQQQKETHFPARERQEIYKHKTHMNDINQLKQQSVSDVCGSSAPLAPPSGAYFC